MSWFTCIVLNVLKWHLFLFFFIALIKSGHQIDSVKTVWIYSVFYNPNPATEVESA